MEQKETNEDDVVCLARLSEIRILRQEAIARMNSLSGNFVKTNSQMERKKEREKERKKCVHASAPVSLATAMSLSIFK